MAHPVFNRETILDISVNIIPIFIITFFIGMILFTSPFEPNLFLEVVAIMLHVIPIVGTALLTYIAAYYI